LVWACHQEWAFHKFFWCLQLVFGNDVLCIKDSFWKGIFATFVEVEDLGFENGILLIKYLVVEVIWDVVQPLDVLQGLLTRNLQLAVCWIRDELVDDIVWIHQIEAILVQAESQTSLRLDGEYLPVVLDVWIFGISLHHEAFSIVLSYVVDEALLILYHFQFLEGIVLQLIELVFLVLINDQLVIFHRVVWVLRHFRFGAEHLRAA